MLDYLVAYESLRLFALKDVAASFNADFGNALNIVLYHTQDIL